MQTLFCLITLAIPFDVLNAQKLVWVGKAEGDLYRAEIVSRQAQATTKNYVVQFEAERFDPFGVRDIDPNIAPGTYFEKLFLLVELPADSIISDYSLEIKIGKSIPVCGACDGGCYQFKELRTQNASIDLNSSTSKSRFLFSISEIVNNWHLMDITVTALLKFGKRKILTSTIGAQGWPWCM